MGSKYVQIETEGAIARVTITRPEKLNALNREIFEALHVAFADLAADPAVRAVILTGSGEKAFVAGADIGELAALDPPGARELSALGQSVMDRIADAPHPVIGAVNGFALGGGLELALACHLRVASRTARLGMPEVTLGLIPGYAGTQRLARLIGSGRALEMIVTGRPIDAEEALRVGLVNRVVAPEELGPTCTKIAEGIASRCGPVAVRAAIEAVQHGLEGTLVEGSRLERTLFGMLWTSADMREGCQAFLEKRKPTFTGR